MASKCSKCGFYKKRIKIGKEVKVTCKCDEKKVSL